MAIDFPPKPPKKDEDEAIAVGEATVTSKERFDAYTSEANAVQVVGAETHDALVEFERRQDELATLIETLAGLGQDVETNERVVELRAELKPFEEIFKQAGMTPKGDFLH